MDDPLEIQPESEKLITTKAYTRIIQEPEYQTEKELMDNPVATTSLISQLNWDVQEDLNIQDVKTPTGTKYLVYSRPVIYAIADKFPHIIDLCIESESKEDALEEFKQRKEEGEKIKRERQKAIEPYLLELSKIPGVIFIGGRGTMYDNRRLAGVYDDIDVSLFLDFDSEEEMSQLLSEVKKTYEKMAEELNVQVWGIEHLAERIRDASNQLLVKRSRESFEVSFDFINFKYTKDQKRIQRIIEGDTYSKDMFAHYVFLGGKKDVFDEFVKKFQ